jgi:hypothetical protein
VAATKVFKSATMEEAVLEKVDDLLVADIDYSGTLVKKASLYLRSVSPCSCFTIARSMQVPERPMVPAKLLVNWSLSLFHSSIEYLSSDSSHVSGAWSRQKGK